MKRTTMIISLLGIIFGLNSIAAKEITFKRQDPKVKDTRTLTSKMQMDLQMTAKVEQIEVGKFAKFSSNQQKKKELVLEVQNAQIKKMKVTYLKDEEIDSEDINQKEAVVKPTSGKTYLLELKDGELLIHYDDGQQPSDREIDLIKKDYKNFGQPDSFTKDLDGKTILIGQKANFLEDSLRSSLGESFPANDVKKMEVRLKGEKDYNNMKCAIFDITILLSTNIDEGVTMDMKLSGDMLVGLNTWPVKLNISGPIGVNGSSKKDGQNIFMNGSGKLEMVLEFDYSDK